MSSWNKTMYNSLVTKGDQMQQPLYWVVSYDNIEQISTAMTTFVQATFVLVTCPVHIMNISAVTDPI